MDLGLNPGDILNAYKYAQRKFGLKTGDSKPKSSGKPKKGSKEEKEAAKVAKKVEQAHELAENGTKDLKLLCRVGGKEWDPQNEQRFTQTRNRTFKGMRAFNKLLQGNDLDEQVKIMSSLRKQMKVLAVQVKMLEPKQYPDVPEVNLDDLDSDAGRAKQQQLEALMQKLAEVDEGDLDKVLAQEVDEGPETESEEDEAGGETTGTTGPTTETQKETPKQKQEKGQAEFKVRIMALLPEIEKAKSAKTEMGQKVNLLSSEANLLARQGKYADAHDRLDEIESRLKLMAQGDTSGGDVPVELHKRLLQAVQTWRAASENVDRQLTELAKVCRADEDEDLKIIAERGIMDVTGNFKAKLMTLCHQVATGAKGPALKQLAAKGAPYALGLLTHIKSSRRVAVCDDNPFGVNVTIVKTLGPALVELGQAFHEMRKL
jgi:hypothetical protein